MSLEESTAWLQLKSLAQDTYKEKHLTEFFHDEKTRADDYFLSIPGIRLDFSKNRIDSTVISSLKNLAEQQEVSSWIKRLFDGEKVNFTEDRAALHSRLRVEQPEQKVAAELDKMEFIVNKIRSGQWRGYSGQPITDVVNIGVGGSDLGPMMAVHALKEKDSPVNVHFISSIDGAQIRQLIAGLDPQRTLFIVASKSFSTIDTLSNAETAKEWLLASACTESLIIKQHFIAITSVTDKAIEWGIPVENQLLIWDWVGGRYSMWSTIGLVIAIAIGMPAFREMLAGANQMDEHFKSTPAEQNMPIMMALVNIWNINFLDINAKSILPYNAHLKYLPAYLQQLVMESNGKSVNRDGIEVNYKTCPLIWGDVGPNAQHAFYQLLHQGTQDVACDFIIPIKVKSHKTDTKGKTADNLALQHELAISNCLAQSRVLMLGDAAIPNEFSDDFKGPHRSYPGNQPSNTLILDDISPRTLGLLIALYENITYVEAVIWEINPFDQWGVELGKKIATSIHSMMQSTEEAKGLDRSTQKLLGYFKK